MDRRRLVVAVLVLGILGIVPNVPIAAGQSPVGPPAAPPDANVPPSADDATPPRLSFVDGQASFWRPGSEDWAPARLNTPLAPGDVLYAGRGGNVEMQIGPRAFVRATDGSQISFDSQEPNFLQFSVTGGTAALDLRQLAPGATIEVDTPGAAVTVERPGFYRVDVDQDKTTVVVHRGGNATVTPAGGAAAPVPSNQQAVVTGADATGVAIAAATELTAWDRWNYQRTDGLIQHVDARYVSAATYGGEVLARHGTWRTVDTYGSVWVPSGVPAGWSPYTTGRWIWDPRFGWTWLDDAPWGWAPYHYGRWVFIGNFWAWAPGPVVVRPVYAPALVVFLGGATISVGHPVCWAPLGWGEPVIPWWGRKEFVGVPSWRGWGGPRVVNNVVINRTTTVNVTNITVYKNVQVNNAVVGVSSDQFGRGHAQLVRVNHTEAQQLKPVRGALEVKPVAASLAPATGPAPKPPAAIQSRPVVATRPHQDVAPALKEHGLTVNAPTVKERLVPAARAAGGDNREQRPRPTDVPAPNTNTPPGATPARPQPRRNDAAGERPTAGPRQDSQAAMPPEGKNGEKPGQAPPPGHQPPTPPERKGAQATPGASATPPSRRAEPPPAPDRQVTAPGGAQREPTPPPSQTRTAPPPVPERQGSVPPEKKSAQDRSAVPPPPPSRAPGPQPQDKPQQMAPRPPADGHPLRPQPPAPPERPGGAQPSAAERPGAPPPPPPAGSAPPRAGGQHPPEAPTVSRPPRPEPKSAQTAPNRPPAAEHPAKAEPQPKAPPPERPEPRERQDAPERK